MRPTEGPADKDGSGSLRSVRPIPRVPRTGAQNFAAVFTIGGGLLFCFFVICLFSPTPTRHLGVTAGIIVAPLVLRSLLLQQPRVKLWWRRAKPRVERHLTIWQRRRRFWPRKKTTAPEPEPVAAAPEPPPSVDPDSVFVPSPRRHT